MSTPMSKDLVYLTQFGISTAAIYYISTMSNREMGIHEINRDRGQYGEYHHLFPQLKKHPERFKRYLRIEISTFYYILQKIEKKIEKNWTNFNQTPILPEEKLVITLRFLATGASYVTLSSNFRMGISTVHELIYDTLDAIWNVFHPIHMPPPTKNDFIRVADEYENKWNFPHCCGAVDGKHCRIKNPRKSGSKFYNYKKFFSIVLQAVTDANYRFLYIDVGGYGEQSDGGTFSVSNFGKAFLNGDLDLPEDDYLPNTDEKLPYVFLADEAYTMNYHMLRPYPAGNGSNTMQDYYNSRHSRARKTVECAFGLLNIRWRILWKPIECEPKNVDKIIVAMCILHNIIIDCEKITPQEMEQAELHAIRYRTLEDRGRRNRHNRSAELARFVRDKYANYFWNINHYNLIDLIKPQTRERWFRDK